MTLTADGKYIYGYDPEALADALPVIIYFCEADQAYDACLRRGGYTGPHIDWDAYVRGYRDGTATPESDDAFNDAIFAATKERNAFKQRVGLD